MFKRLALAALSVIAIGVAIAWSQSFTMPPPAGVIVNGCVFTTTPPTLATTNLGLVQCDAQGRLLISPGASGAAGFPSAATPITATATGTTTAIATLAAAAGKTTYLCGIQATYTGATTAGAGTVIATNTITGALNYVASQVASTTNNQFPTIITFSPCIPASAVNTTIPVAATLGAGTTNTAVTLNGFQQ